jgi:endonuclease/exonuclease/phosphatase family metal-dependent hydrolase
MKISSQRTRNFYLSCVGLFLLSSVLGCTNESGTVQPGTTANGDNTTANGDNLAEATAKGETTADVDDITSTDDLSKKVETVRFATFNVALNRSAQGGLLAELESGESPKTEKIAEIIQRVRPDVLLLNEFDYDADGKALEIFQNDFLGKSHKGQDPIEYEFVYFQAVNTGVDSQLDLNDDGEKGTADDAYGYGKFPGQYGMVVLSRFPIDWEKVRTFQNFLWKDMPDFLWPYDPASEKQFYNNEIKAIFRLSSKSHWDVPIKIGDRSIHFLVSHPTPPVFDGEEDRNGCRNHDEIRFWADYVSEEFDYHYDDNGDFGSLPAGADFVIAGDLNADPADGDSRQNAAHQVTKHPKIDNSFSPQSIGGVYYAKAQGKANEKHTGNPAFDTSDFNDARTGNMRIDYCLPSKTLTITGSGVFWPTPDELGGDLPGASDHRLTWIDIEK